MHILEKIDNYLRPSLNEAQHHDLAAKVLKMYGVSPPGLNVRHLVRGIADKHGVPAQLVPQVLHHYLDAHQHELHDSNYRENTLSDINGDLSRYASHGKTSTGHPGAFRMEDAVDHAEAWHSLASHSKARAALNSALVATDGNQEHAARLSEWWHSPDADGRQFDWSGSVGHQRHAHKYLVKHAASYNPAVVSTWPSLSVRTTVRIDGTSLNTHGVSVDDIRAQMESADRHLSSLRGIKPSYPHDAEHTHNGVTYRGYTLDTPEKADTNCWGNKFCIATHGRAQQMSEMYHGGHYGTSHIITRIGKDDAGQPVEHLHAAYLPHLLPNGMYANPEQAVRNSANNGAVTRGAFDVIHPLLSKLDKRIDHEDHRGIPPHVYYRHGSHDYEQGYDKHLSPERQAANRAADEALLRSLSTGQG